MCKIEPTALQRIIDLGELHPRATMLIAQQAHLASIFEGTTAITSDLVEAGFLTARQRDRGKHQQILDRIRKLRGKATSRRALVAARAIARGEQLYRRSNTDSATETRRAVDALHDAGIIEAKTGRQGWKIVDPLFRLYLADIDPTRI